MWRALFPAVTIISLVSMGAYGCGRKAATEPVTPNSPPTSGETGEWMEHGEHDHGERLQGADSGKSDMEKMKTESAQLTPEDAASAEKQHFCSVSGEMLGTMGAPQKLDVNGRQVWICCDSCKDTLLENPHDYLAKMPKD